MRRVKVSTQLLLQYIFLSPSFPMAQSMWTFLQSQKKKPPHKTQWMHFKIKEFYKLHVLRIFWILTKHKLDTSQINCIHGSTACSMLCRVTSLFLSQCLSQSGHWVKRSELSLLQGEKCGWKSVGISRCYGTFQHFRVTLFFSCPSNVTETRSYFLAADKLTVVKIQPSQWYFCHGLYKYSVTETLEVFQFWLSPLIVSIVPVEAVGMLKCFRRDWIEKNSSLRAGQWMERVACCQGVKETDWETQNEKYGS